MGGLSRLPQGLVVQLLTVPAPPDCWAQLQTTQVPLPQVARTLQLQLVRAPSQLGLSAWVHEMPL